MRMRLIGATLLVALLLVVSGVSISGAPPATCSIGQGYYDTVSGNISLYYCAAANTWTLQSIGGGPGATMPVAGAVGAIPYFSTTGGMSSIPAVTAGMHLRSNGAGAAPIWSTLVLPNAAVAGTHLIATTTNTVIAVAPALTHATPANQTGNATATLKMNGLGSAAAACTITPVATGRVVFTITGQRVQSTTADGVVIKLAVGAGTAPANAAAVTGSVISATQTWTGLTGQLTDGFAITASTTGLALGTAVWYDLQIADVTGGTASVTNIDCTAHEV